MHISCPNPFTFNHSYIEIVIAHPQFQQGNDPNSNEFVRMDLEEEHFFFCQGHTIEYKYEIIFVHNAFPTITDKAEQPSEKDKGFLCSAEVKKSCDKNEMSSPSAKWTLFLASSEQVLSNIKVEEKLATSNFKDDQVTAKGKLD